MLKGILLNFCLFCLFCLRASSQVPLTQLDFDEIVRQKQKEKGQANVIIQDKAKEIVVKEFQLSGSPLEFITPSLESVSVDENSKDAITSNLFWQADNQSDCFKGLSQDIACKKSSALKEFIYRFSGTDDYFNDLCKEHTCGQDERPLPTAISVQDNKKSVYDILYQKGKCRFYYRKNGQKQDWSIIRLKSVTCGCLSSQCKIK